MNQLHHALVGPISPPTLTPLLPRPPRAAAPKLPPGPRAFAGNWKYNTGLGSRGPLLLAIFISAGLHVLFLYGFNTKPAPKVVIHDEEPVIQIAMPELKDLDEPEPVDDLEGAAEEAPAVSVPMLADVPSAVAVTSFVQPIQFQADMTNSLNAAKATSIPVNIARGRGGAGQFGKVFEISQLDRVPEPLAQPAPVFPYSLRKEVQAARVLVEFIVDSQGNVVGAVVVESTHPGFDQAALAGVTKWKFRPGVKAGRKVNTRVRAPLIFRTVEGED